MTTATTQKTTPKMPRLAWHDQLRLKFKSAVAHTYIITGNVRDVVDNRLTLETYLAGMFLKPINGKRQFDLVVFYDRANGLRFPDPDMENIFRRAVGLHVVATATTGIFGPGKSGDGPPIPKDPKTCFELIEKILRDDSRTEPDDSIQPEGNRVLHSIVVIDYAESLFPAGTWSQLLDADRDRIVKILNWAKDGELTKANNPIFLIADSASNLHDSLTASSSRIEILESFLPTPEERLSFVRHMEKSSIDDGKGPIQYEEGYNAEAYARHTAGLRKISIEDIKMTAQHSKRSIGPEIVKERKRQIFATEYDSVLEMVEPEHGFEIVGGMQHIKLFLKQDVIAPMLAGDLKRVPMGLLLTGASGTGKTILAEALAYESGFNMCRLDVSKMLGSLVGQSEAACRKAFLAIRSLTPILVFVDEADQMVNRGSHGDSGVSNRIFKMFLEFMSDTRNRGKVIFILATNRIDTLDAALKRPGRIDKIIPFLPPDASERAPIFPAVFLRYGYEADGKINFGDLAAKTDGWVGSDIENAIVKSYSIACREDRTKISQADIEQALNTMIPATASTAHWTNLALLECNDTDLLPPAMRQKFQERRKQAEREVERARTRGTYTSEPVRRATGREDLL